MLQGIVLSATASVLFAVLYYYAVLLQPLDGMPIFGWRIVLGLLAQRDSALPPVTADGIFGAATAAAVRTLQSRLGYSPTGAVGPVLWSYIITQGQGYGVF